MIIQAREPKDIIASHATLEFTTRMEAKDFARKWKFRTFTGYCMSPNDADGKVRVTVYKLDQSDIDWLHEMCKA